MLGSRLALPLASILLIAPACDDGEDTAASAATKPAAETAPAKADEAPAKAAEEAEAPADPVAAEPPSSPELKTNLNTATKEQFLAIPGVGKRMAHEFDEYRPYVSIQQFRKEIGKYVDADKVAEYERWVFVPVDPNAADVDTLQQLPGVDAAAAEALIGGRPYAAPADFEKALADKAGPERAAAGAKMLTAG
jgi:DNA uptake protein ComE-like DNA-binding protein